MKRKASKISKKKSVVNLKKQFLPSRNSRRKPSTALLAVLSVSWLLAPFANAQAVADIDQTGTANNALIEQEAAGSSPYAHITQDGDNNDAYMLQVGPVDDYMAGQIRQIGSFNSATTEQSDIRYSASVFIQQTGEANDISTTQIGSQQAGIDAHQSGEFNDAFIEQIDTTSSANLNQNGSGNSANIHQSGIDTYFQHAVVEQEGQGNTQVIFQTDMGMNELESRQAGRGNYAYVHQSQTPDISYGVAQVRLSTVGDNNATYVEQINNPAGDFDLIQDGNSNLILVYQSGENADTHIKNQKSDFNVDDVYQVGLDTLIEVSRYYTDNSSTEVTQTSFADYVFIEQGHSEGAEAVVWQTDNIGAQAKIRQVRTGNVLAQIGQVNITGQASIEQRENVTSSTALIAQGGFGSGNSNLIAAIYQTNGTDLSSAEIYQAGNDNMALIEQEGVTDNSATLWQDGNGGFAEILQTGLGGGFSNTASITQSGEGYSASIQQSGSDNSAAISQM